MQSPASASITLPLSIDNYEIDPGAGTLSCNAKYLTGVVTNANLIFMTDQNNCWEIKKCSAAQYLNCKAYAEKKHCWEVSDPRGSRSLLLCLQLGCPVYDLYMEEIDKEIESRLKMMFPFLGSIDEEKAPQG